LTRAVFRWRALSSPRTAAAAIDKLTGAAEISGAVKGLRDAAAASGAKPGVVTAALRKLKGNRAAAESIARLQAATLEADAALVSSGSSGGVEELR
jgi:hypothetical protein